MLIITQNDGVYNFDGMLHIGIYECDGTYSLRFVRESSGGFIGEWTTREEAVKALDDIVKGYHLGNKEVYLK